MLQKHGRHLPSADSEAGPFTFVQSADTLTQARNGMTNAREWFGWLRNPDLTVGWAAEDLVGYFDGFGQARTVAMPMRMFQPLRGRYVDCTSEAPGVEAVSALDGDQLVCVALNDRPEERQMEFRLGAPRRAAFTRLQVRMLWHDFKANSTRYARFQPRSVRGADSINVEVRLPAFGLCTLEATLDRPAPPGRTVAQQRYPGDRVVFWVEPGKVERLRIALPREALDGRPRRYLLRIGYERAGAESAIVTLNGRQRFVLPPHIRTGGWDISELAEFLVDGSDLRPNNEVVFTVAPGTGKYLVVMASVVASNRAPTRAARRPQTVVLDTGSPDCSIAGEEARALPDWYVRERDAAPAAMPEIRAYWSFDREVDGIVPDQSGQGHDGRLMKGAILADGVSGKALQLDGKGACMCVADSPSLRLGRDESFSLCFWVKLQAGGKGSLLWKGRSDHITVSIRDQTCGSPYPYPLVEGELRSEATFSGGRVRATTNMSDAQWHHVVLVRDVPEEVLLIYVDGRYEGSMTGFLDGDLDSPEPLYLGADADGNPCIHGLLDEVILFGGALTPTQVAELHAH